MTNPTPHGQVPAIQRYKIGYHSDEWGVRSLSPTGIYDDAGPWVRYEDHAAQIAALRAQQPAPATQQAGEALSDDLRDRLVAISEAVAYQDDRAAQAMLREILKAPQADSQPAPVLLSDEELCQIEEPYLLNFRIPLGGQYDFARAVEKAVLAKTYGTQAPQPSPTAQAAESVPAVDASAAPKLRAMAINYPEGASWDKLDAQTCMDGALEIEALRAARAPAESVGRDAEQKGGA